MPNVEMTMQPEEFAELRQAVAVIGMGDVQLGRVLDALLLHLGHSHGLDTMVEDARLAAEARQLAREEEDAQVAAAKEQAAAPVGSEVQSAN